MKELPSTRQQLELLDAYLQVEDRWAYRLRIMKEILRLAEILEHKEAALPIIKFQVEFESQIIYENYNLHRRESDGRTDCAMRNEVRNSSEVFAG